MLVATALTASAAAQDKPKTETNTETKPALNLRLDEGTSAAPRISFGQAPATQSKEAREKGLPELGGRPVLNFDRPINPQSAGSPIPKDPMQ